jgi:hypothetical protein
VERPIVGQALSEEAQGVIDGGHVAQRPTGAEGSFQDPLAARGANGST